MTDKQIFDELKGLKREKRRKLKMINMLKASVNRKLNFNSHTEDEEMQLLQQLHEIELNEIRLRRNKNDSKAFSFEPKYRINLGLN